MSAPAPERESVAAVPLLTGDEELAAGIAFICATAAGHLERDADWRARRLAMMRRVAAGMFTRLPVADLAAFLERICSPEPGRC